MKIEEKLKNVFNQFIGSKIDTEMMNAMQLKIKEFFHNELSDESNHIDFEYSESNGKIKFKPKNLFTALILLGHYKPYFLIEGKEFYHLDGLGTVLKNEDTDTFYLLIEEEY